MSISRRRSLPWVILGGASFIILAGALLALRAEAGVNRVALDQAPKLVTVIEARHTTYRGARRYVGTIEPWLEARLGPQLVSAYVDAVLVRPGAVVQKGEVLATLDCRNATASSQAVAMQARAIAARQEAASHEAARLNDMLDGGFVSPNEVEQKSAQSAAERAQLLSTQAELRGSSLLVDDCVLRAPFAGEIATRSVDPGAFARPGIALVRLVDRSTVRIVADAPEIDYAAVAPGNIAQVRAVATGTKLRATISRRAPAADDATRTVHFEMDVTDPDRALPVGSTADISIEVGDSQPALEIPLPSATVRDDRATLFVVEQGVARQRVAKVLGERAGSLFLDPSTLGEARIVSQGRALLADGDRVQASLDDSASKAEK